MADYSNIFPDLEDEMYAPGALEAKLTLAAQENPFSIPYMLASRIRGQKSRGDYFDDLNALTQQRADRVAQLNKGDTYNNVFEDFYTKKGSPQQQAEVLGLPFNRPDFVELSQLNMLGRRGDVAKTAAETTKTLAESGQEINPVELPFQELGLPGLKQVPTLGERSARAADEGGADPNDPLVEVEDTIFTKPGDPSATKVKRKMKYSELQRLLEEKKAAGDATRAGDTSAANTGAGQGGQPKPKLQQKTDALGVMPQDIAATPQVAGTSVDPRNAEGGQLVPLNELQKRFPSALAGMEKVTINAGEKVQSVTVSPDNRLLSIVLYSPTGTRILKIDAQTGQVVR